MNPPCGGRLVRHVGDVMEFTLCGLSGSARELRVFLRTTIGRGHQVREEIIRDIEEPDVQLEGSWRDVPMRFEGGGWSVKLALTEVGWFQSKAYAVDAEGRQHWPEGNNIGLSVHPNACRTANTIYCAFPRMFGLAKNRRETASMDHDPRITSLDDQGYTVIPPSGTLRDLKAELPHIFETLDCRILHLLPVNPTPTTYARMGRFGSPYACGDLTSIDPALVEFDKRTTGVEQFRELARGVHSHGGQLFLDLVINHTGWGSTLQENHPEWFLREPNGDFASPGAWGNVWADLVELEPNHPELWEHMASAFLEWCRRGVDGFRCDAGYKVPMPVWRYVTARVREHFPDTVFLLEGLGGGWGDTAALLTEGGMQWAYSELFQEYTGGQVAGYLDHALAQSERVGTLIHYSETHDNSRLAAKGRAWSLLRNRLCALTSVNGGFGFANGVEWQADEQINVHFARGLNWGADDNIVSELAQLNRLINQHPCFRDGARLERLSDPESSLYQLRRTSADGASEVRVLANLDLDEAQFIDDGLVGWVELLSGNIFEDGRVPPGAVLCLAPETPELGDDLYEEKRAQAAWAYQCLSVRFEPEELGGLKWLELAELAAANPAGFVAGIAAIQKVDHSSGFLTQLREAASSEQFPRINIWRRRDASRVMPVPVGHWLMVYDEEPFEACLLGKDGTLQLNSVEMENAHVASFGLMTRAGRYELEFQERGDEEFSVGGSVEVVGPDPSDESFDATAVRRVKNPLEAPVALLTNGRGGMARIPVDLGAIKSKYDCLLGANLHVDAPVDRHVFAKRIRLWAVADGFISALDATNLVHFEPGPPARWRFLVSAGDFQAVELEVEAAMAVECNATVLTFRRLDEDPLRGRKLLGDKEFSLTARIDLEDRSFHGETHLSREGESYFEECLECGDEGFVFAPAADRVLRADVVRGCFHAEVEPVYNVAHPVEASRGQTEVGDAYSPGWFEMPLKPSEESVLTLSAEAEPVSPSSNKVMPVTFEGRLRNSMEAFVVNRGEGKTVVAGYPWFLDWGRDTFIAARGLLAAGWSEEVFGIVKAFARFEDRGSLPNVLNGDNASNRETSDAPLWFGKVCAELAGSAREDLFSERMADGRTLREILISIGCGYRDGTPQGIRMDLESGLIWSPSHFTWMDTNYPAGTPREGYPVEIQALWIQLLGLLGLLDSEGGWGDLELRVRESLRDYFCRTPSGWIADLLPAAEGVEPSDAPCDDALRSNGLMAVALGGVPLSVGRATVLAACDHLVVPGGMRSLAPLSVAVPLPVRSQAGDLLNDPIQPYWDRYEGDEDTRRKPAYHNGTAWGWQLPFLSESIMRCWPGDEGALKAARSYLLTMEPLLNSGCIGHLPEVMDGDAPHTQRGCDAQAWSATEAYRVWQLLQN